MLNNQESSPTGRPILRLKLLSNPWIEEKVKSTRYSIEWVFWESSKESREKEDINPWMFIPYADIVNRRNFSVKKELAKKVWVKIPQDMLAPQIFLSFYKLSNEDISAIGEFVWAEDINRINKWQKSEGKLKAKLVKSGDNFFLKFWNHHNPTQIKVEVQVRSGAKK